MTPGASRRGVEALDTWRFLRIDSSDASLEPVRAAFDDATWEQVTLPHTARLEDAVTGAAGSETAQWQGTCWYRRSIHVGDATPGRQVWLRFGAAMNVADVWLDDHHLGTHLGGFTPFAYDITDLLVPGKPATIAVRLDNRDNAVTGPKPLAQLDFNTYGGLYRTVELVTKPALHITDPILANRPASGGVLVQCLAASVETATVRAQVHVRNASRGARTFVVRHRLVASDGRTAAEGGTTETTLAAGEDRDVVAMLEVPSPALWHPHAPNLYTLHCDVMEGEHVVDSESARIGLRRWDVTSDGLRINGQPAFLRGTNRHQEYPYIGYALSDAAQYRDARLIKEAGFDYVRLSHYLHAPAFMDACDELGLVVMNCLPGWQYFNGEDPAFTALQYENVRTLIRRDRNHACVLLWEASLNETAMPAPFIERTHVVAHEEYPGDQCFTCGWAEGYDVFIQARQHGGCVGITRPCVVSEYGDWEYYAQNAGFNQSAWADLAPGEANSRQMRWHGERALLQQATNFQEAHNDNRKTTAFADGLWAMFDYNRGYAPDIESSGCADLFRIPKFSYHFFRSQRDADDQPVAGIGGPMVYIASYWTAASSPSVRVFSNAEEVSLSLNGSLVGRQRPDQDRISTHLAHPPFTFQVPSPTPGTLEAVAYIGGQPVARHVVQSPGVPSVLSLRLEEHGRSLGVRGKDAVFLHASLQDTHGTLAVAAWENVAFGALGSIALVGRNPYSTEAGMASILVQASKSRPRGSLYALAMVSDGDSTRVLTASLGVGGAPSPYSVHVTGNDQPPSASSPRYVHPVPSTPTLQAALIVRGHVVATLRADAPRVHLPGSAAPSPAR